MGTEIHASTSGGRALKMRSVALGNARARQTFRHGRAARSSGGIIRLHFTIGNLTPILPVY